MNTPTHLMLSVAALSRRGETDEPTFLWPAVAGALLPDAPMYVFYAVEKFALGSTEREIWTTRYYLPAWQDFFDLFNSVPLVAVGLIVALVLKQRGWSVLLLSMLLHIACDLPLHHDDGHRHLWPISEWRYESPVSYWDPNHFGREMMGAELALFLACYLWSMLKHRSVKIRAGLTLLAAIHLGFITFALVIWAGL